MKAWGRSRRLWDAMQGTAARRGWADQSEGDARPPSAPRGGQALARSATDDGGSFRFSRARISLTARIDDDLTANP